MPRTRPVAGRFRGLVNETSRTCPALERRRFRRDRPMSDPRRAGEHTHATENDNLKPPKREGESPRPATEPDGSEGSSNSGETETDPATGREN